MKSSVLISAVCVALAALPATAAPIVFNTTGAIVDYTVPVSGQYTITAFGAKGGDGVPTRFDSGGAGTGGFGAEAGGIFALTQGEILQVLVGAAGVTDPMAGVGGGGGGSFVVGPGDVPLVVAGGGGGGGDYPAAFGPAPGYNGGDALTGPNGGPTSVPGYPNQFETDGLGGIAGTNGQGGTFQFSGNASTVNFGRGFDSFPSGLGGGAFGGGGSTEEFPGVSAPGGGGGGYSGGGGGGQTTMGSVGNGIGNAGGGGGGSFTAGTLPVLLARVGTGNGSVTITPGAGTVAVPEPAGLVLFGIGLFGLCTLRQARRRV